MIKNITIIILSILLLISILTILDIDPIADKINSIVYDIKSSLNPIATITYKGLYLDDTIKIILTPQNATVDTRYLVTLYVLNNPRDSQYITFNFEEIHKIIPKEISFNIYNNDIYYLTNDEFIHNSLSRVFRIRIESIH